MWIFWIRNPGSVFFHEFHVMRLDWLCLKWRRARLCLVWVWCHQTTLRRRHCRCCRCCQCSIRRCRNRNRQSRLHLRHHRHHSLCLNASLSLSPRSFFLTQNLRPNRRHSTSLRHSRLISPSLVWKMCPWLFPRQPTPQSWHCVWIRLRCLPLRLTPCTCQHPQKCWTLTPLPSCWRFKGSVCQFPWVSIKLHSLTVLMYYLTHTLHWSQNPCLAMFTKPILCSVYKPKLCND